MLTYANNFVVPKAKVFVKTRKGVTMMHKGNAVRIQTKISLKTILHRYNIDRKKEKKKMCDVSRFRFRFGSRFSKQTTYDSHTQRLPNKRCWEYPCQNVSAFEKAYKPMLRNKSEKNYYITSKPMPNINMQGNKMQRKTPIKMQNKFKTDKETICSICVRFWLGTN